MAFSRADTSVLGRWWWTVDRWTLAALLALIGFGYVMMLAASPAVAERIGASSRHMFFIKQVAYLMMATALMVATSLEISWKPGSASLRIITRASSARMVSHSRSICAAQGNCALS